MSDGLYKSLEEATRTDQVNKDLAQMAVEQVGTESVIQNMLCIEVWLYVFFVW
jgi:hypothetical protein